MIRLDEMQRGRLEALCRKYEVRSLEIFGSAVEGQFDEQMSDLDFLVDFLPASANAADRYFGLRDELAALFGRSVDLVMLGALRNRFFVQSVNRTRTPLHAA